MTNLKVGDRVKFRCWDGTVVSGTVYAVAGIGLYLVLGETICSTYPDGLYRFRDRDVVGPLFW